ncbi:MAG: GPO family capsid scaffolding protein [Proteobacteria bacterium]|nr:GPO family capsid scaffolding protein [Pseudomonadota bacterium]
MTKLTTDFVRIGRSGKAIDGRDIDPQWLRDMAEGYDPSVYTAMIWPEHLRVTNFGKVLELATEEANGVVTLLARLQPNANYVLDNRYGQHLFFSMELAQNFAGTGKTYLVGLGVTDSPASLGTDELKFSARHTHPGSIFLPGEAFSLPRPEEVPGWFTRFMEKFIPSNPNEEHEETMDKAQYEALTGKLDTMTADVAALKEKFEALSVNPEKDAAKPEKDAAQGGQSAEGDGAPDRFASIEAGMTKLGEQLAEIKTRFETANPGTKVPPTQGAAADADVNIL